MAKEFIFWSNYFSNGPAHRRELQRNTTEGVGDKKVFVCESAMLTHTHEYTPSVNAFLYNMGTIIIYIIYCTFVCLCVSASSLQASRQRPFALLRCKEEIPKKKIFLPQQLHYVCVYIYIYIYRNNQQSSSLCVRHKVFSDV